MLNAIRKWLIQLLSDEKRADEVDYESLGKKMAREFPNKELLGPDKIKKELLEKIISKIENEINVLEKDVDLDLSDGSIERLKKENTIFQESLAIVRHRDANLPDKAEKSPYPAEMVALRELIRLGDWEMFISKAHELLEKHKLKNYELESELILLNARLASLYGDNRKGVFLNIDFEIAKTHVFLGCLEYINSVYLELKEKGN